MTSRVLLLSAAAVLVVPVLGPSSASEASRAAPTGPCAAPTLIGTDRGETLRGTEGPDVIAGLGGDDRLLGLGGDDVLCGGNGKDVLRGGPGTDRLYGGRDAKVAEDTDYYVYYGDTLDGGTGDDVLVPGGDRRHPGSVDTVDFGHAVAGISADLATGVVTSTGPVSETDTIVGATGNFVGTGYADTIVGSDRAEDIYAGDGPDHVDGRGGDDWVDGGQIYQDDRSDNVLLGGAGADTVNAGRGDDLLRGGPGNDLLQAGRGVDRSYGGVGLDGVNDEVEDAPGQVLSGGPGRRDYLSDASFHNARGRYQQHLRGRIEMVPGTLTTRLDGHVLEVAVPGFEEVATPAGDLWTVIGTPGNDQIYSGLDGAVRIYGRAGNDRIFGGLGSNDYLNGGPGRDAGNGWGGRDRLVSIEKIFR